MKVLDVDAILISLLFNMHLISSMGISLIAKKIGKNEKEVVRIQIKTKQN